MKMFFIHGTIFIGSKVICKEDSMRLLIKDLLQLKVFRSIDFIAGKNGWHNEVKGVGLLDYELDVEFHDRYVYENLYEGLLCLTTFLYAKDQDYLMLEAIKKLHIRKCSGLVIKNIYNLPISAKIIRYADSINFPIFLIEGNTVLFENIILEVNSFDALKSSTDSINELFDSLLYGDLSEQEIVNLTYRLVPSIKNHYRIYYFYPKNSNFCDEYSCPENEFCFKYHDGNFYISSSDSTDEKSLQVNPRVFEQINVGVSDVHHFAKFFRDAVQQAYYSSIYTQLIGINQASYSDLGVFQLILSNTHNVSFTNFSSRVISEIKDYDVMYNGELLTTLTTYIMSNCDLDVASSVLKVHKNTIKYRLDRLKDVLDLDYRCFNDLEKLSLSVKIYLCSKLGS